MAEGAAGRLDVGGLMPVGKVSTDNPRAMCGRRDLDGVAEVVGPGNKDTSARLNQYLREMVPG